MLDSTYQRSITILRKNNVRITPQRQIILKYLIHHRNHPSVETIYHSVAQKFTNLSIATVYNTLELLNRLNIIIELPSRGTGLRFDFFGTPHFHAICERCGRIFDVKDPQYTPIDQKLKRLTVKHTRFKVHYSKIEIYGLCPICQRELRNLKNG